MSSAILARHLGETLRLNRNGPIFWPALRSFLSVLLPLATLFQLDRMDLVAGAVFGGLTSVYCRSEPSRHQIRSLAVVAAGMVVAVALGDLIALWGLPSGRQQLVAVVGTAVVGAVATAATTAARVGAPGGLIFAFATGACANLSLSPDELPAHLTVCALSGAFAWGVCSLGAVLAGLRPQRRAVAAALEATAAHLANPDLDGRHRAAVAIENARTRLPLVSARRRESTEYRELVRAVEVCEVLLGASRVARATVWSLRATAERVRTGQPLHPPGYARPDRPLGPGPPPSRWWAVREVLLATARPRRGTGTWLLPFAARVGTAALISGVAAQLLGLGHTYWAAVSAVSVLQATSTSRSVPRMLQRVAGTLGGVVLGMLLLSLHPRVWVIILLLAALQWAAEMTVTINYAFGLLFVTPVALLVGGMMSSAPPEELAASRLWTTLLGAAVAVLVARLAPHRAWLVRVRDALDRVRRLVELGGAAPRQQLRQALVELHDAYDTAAGEVPDEHLPTEELLRVSRRAYRLLDERDYPSPRPRETAG
ncbi:FUSC family protein [Actinopolyspora mortivallis]|uniref:FUSC family protein n=1 Tax=Actinopolyspora mortivallis TaxID=33906 RepID=UPI0021593957|nr:FUSC family protein [Actinopolyspora mortivallis]